MNRFILIDDKLNQMATDIGGHFIKNANNKMELPEGFEKRRIQWNNNELNLAIQIHPTLTDGDNLNNKWSFVAIAWQDVKANRYSRITKFKIDCSLNEIVEDIDQLLYKSIDLLNKTVFNDLHLNK